MTEVELLDPSISDHCPISVTVKAGIKFGPKPFRFQTFWMNSCKFHGLLNQAWKKEGEGNPIQRLYQKLRILKKDLLVLNKEDYSGISSRVG